MAFVHGPPTQRTHPCKTPCLPLPGELRNFIGNSPPANALMGHHVHARDYSSQYREHTIRCLALCFILQRDEQLHLLPGTLRLSMCESHAQWP